MDMTTVTLVIVGSSGTIIIGMAALIKTMIMSEMKEIRNDIKEMREEVRKIDRHDSEIGHLATGLKEVKDSVNGISTRVSELERTRFQTAQRLAQCEGMIRGHVGGESVSK